ncbi:HlyD family efflux transporter periplasmic adaptor subunit [Eubacterium oxidoreducens]|uniref:RND related barrel-sandwich hybrid domain-containing protein n=1 Tax=Eubacterium oxidoreducens TaxID=1732 RepID=A0A1G6ALJ3_EUBOX|nr:HlyD family efflux transporter periplasmic adaptor subunit [Eubacterium oxidoreducens]SDB09264.1 hypothetical protein SAMN02910417_00681 [Eubacterium oxidoreducens]
MSSSNKIVKYKRPIQLNIGIIIFLVIFVYLVFQMVAYATQKHVTIYEVQTGEIAEGNEYTGLILRSEKVINSEESGYLNFYQENASKIGKGDTIYSIDEDGSYYQKIKEAAMDGSSITSDEFSSLASQISDYMGGFEDDSFSSIYSFKTNLNSKVSEVLSIDALDALEESENLSSNDSFHIYQAPTDGIIEYYVDGYEDVTLKNITADQFDSLSYSKTSLSSLENVTAETSVYKIITSEKWKMLIPISEETKELIADEDYLKITIKKDGESIWGAVKFKTIDKQEYLVLTFNNSMIRYSEDRFVSVKLEIDTQSGLKIPKSAITKKDFYVIPKDYFTKGNDSSDEGLLVKQEESNNVVFEALTIYYEDDDYYYIDPNALEEGTVIQKPDSDETYTVKTTKSLKGVYNINKGYAIFKQIEITAQNAEYAIISDDTDYGLNQYDHIALDGSIISEGELVN